VNNYIKFGYGFYFFRGAAVWKKEDGSFALGTTSTNTNSPIYLQLRRIGDELEGRYHGDGAAWVSVETWTPNPVFPSTIMIGVAAGDGNAGVNYSSEFDYFRVRKLADPEPVVVVGEEESL